MNRILLAAATVATTGATAINVNPQILGEVGRWPATVVLGTIAAICVWLMYRQGVDFSRTQERTADAVRDLVAELKQRPCVRHPSND